MSGWIDATVRVHPGMPVYPGDPPVRWERFAAIAGGDAANTTRLDMCAHAGTHVDAPAHAIDGAGGVEAIPLEALVGPAWVAAAGGGGGPVRLGDLDLPDGVERLLLRTQPEGAVWTERPIEQGHRYLDEAAARELAARGVRLVGIDRVSIAAMDDPMPAHAALLERGVAIVEGLDLSRAGAGAWDLVCLPALLAGCDGAPARALLAPPGTVGPARGVTPG